MEKITIDPNDFEKSFLESKLNYFYNFFQNRSASQHMNLLSEFESFVNMAIQDEKEKKKYFDVVLKINKTPVLFFLEENKNFYPNNVMKQIDSELTLSSLDYLYFRDTSFYHNLKTSYHASYRKPGKGHKVFYFYQLLDVMSFIRKYLKINIDKLAQQLEIIPELILPDVEEHDTKKQVGI